MENGVGRGAKSGRFSYAFSHKLMAAFSHKLIATFSHRLMAAPLHGPVIIVLVILAISAPAHGRNFALTRNIDGYVIDVTINQNPPIVGKNDIRVEIKDPAGKYVGGALVTVNYFMPPMPSMPPMNFTIKALPRGPGYDATMVLIMKGPWNIVIRAGVGAKQLRMTVLVDVR
jgi:hypothetical protein